MIKAVIFDMFETLVSLFTCERYQGEHIAADIGISESKFREIWNPSEYDRTCGRISFEEVIRQVLEANKIDEDRILELVSHKRREMAYYPFETFHEEIIPMLEGLKEQNIKIALITNCFFEERDAIKESKLYPFFDVPVMSCEVGMKKPDIKIFELCLEKLGLTAKECLYVGDGGSRELETAKMLGMQTRQAVWYLNDSYEQPVGKMNEFESALRPMDILRLVRKD